MSLSSTVRMIVVAMVMFTLMACGGGGGSAKPTNSGGGNDGGNGGGDTGGGQTTSPGTFTVSHNKVGYNASEYENKYFEQEIVGSLSSVSEGAYIEVDTSSTFLIEDVSVVLSDTESSGTMTLRTVNSSTLQPGNYYGIITIRACTTQSCERHYTGSPATIEVMYSVLPNENPDINCEDQYGVVFDECVDPDWIGAAAWEMTTDGRNVQLKHTDGDNPERLVNWSLLQTEEEGYNTVLDVQYNRVNANGSLRFPATFDDATGMPVNDLNRFANGTLEFDIRVLDWAAAMDLSMHIECFWPCATNNVILEGIGTNTWTHFSFPVADLVADGLNLDTVTTGLLIEPTWDAMEGLHYQLDNVRWVPGNGDPAEGEPYAGDVVVNIEIDASGLTPMVDGSAEAVFLSSSPDYYVEPNWRSTTDIIYLETMLDEPVNMSNDIIATMVVVIPDSYTTSTVSARMFVRDTYGREARALVTQLSDHAGHWLQLRMDTLSFDVEAEFDPTAVEVVGVSLFTNGVDVDENAEALRFREIEVRNL